MSLENFPNFLLNFSECGMNGEENHFYQFKSFRLNIGERQLLHNNSPVSLTPKAFDVLAALVTRSGHLVEKEELLRLVWADSFVEEANIPRIVHTLRKTLGEDENGNKFIETVAKKGYRFVAEVSVSEPPAVADGSSDLGLRIGDCGLWQIRNPQSQIRNRTARPLPQAVLTYLERESYFSPPVLWARFCSSRCWLLIGVLNLLSIPTRSNQSPFCL
jgi:DNA-binding winged helix-turn-helix (wHTH) protein